MAWAPGGSIPSGARGGFRTTVKTISTMIDRGRKRISASMEALNMGKASACTTRITPAEKDAPPALPGSGEYQPQQMQTLPGTDIRNFDRSSRAKTGKVG